ncbi:hypothetical protein SAMN04488009_2765 [Maribacter sedimenticola]|uniref:Uncharacterized protein n=1 Tax=Maribacter sedimenticola TaxID=228956 RepID=A0ABY1SIZ8_9FLAO|nr:hypothetical protein [Maribacter sedimenticola]SNR60377.1 hypothetical protein SAMN04488009_2765 [Maribacter sedimenticola]
MEGIIVKYIAQNNQKFHRYNSWNHCYSAFENKNLDTNTLALYLGMYLASWGMYRGSSGLLQKDYLVHEGAVEILKSFSHLRCSGEHEVNKLSIPEIEKLITLLKKHYRSFQFETLKGVTKNISPTDTLISKILLGTLGCVPAFDRFFIEGVIKKEEAFKSLQKNSLEKLFEYADNNEKMKMLQKKYSEYPKMKLVDMYFWQVGFNKNRKDKK